MAGQGAKKEHTKSASHSDSCLLTTDSCPEFDIATGKWEKATEELEKVMGAAGDGDGDQAD